jgi:NDP-sugar pyrophosphorylase family protein
LPATCLQNIDVVILAGGLGTRLRPAVSDRPKVLAPVNGVPFLKCYLGWLRGFGARRIILSLGHQAGMVENFVKSEDWNGMEIVANVETTPLGTGGAVRACLPLVQSSTALVANGDSVARLDLCRFVEFHGSKSAQLSMVLTHQPQPGAFGLVETDKDGAVISFNEKPQNQNAGGFINAGLYLMQRDVIEEIPAGKPLSIEKDVFPKFCGHGFYALKGEFPFIDIGTPESYQRAGKFFRGEAA